jgi:hypothetical protein
MAIFMMKQIAAGNVMAHVKHEKFTANEPLATAITLKIVES